MTIYQILAAMPDQQIEAIWQALADQTTDYSEPYSTTYHPGVTMGDWVQAVYSEMDRRNMPHFTEEK
jgi:hypothetical protein